MDANQKYVCLTNKNTIKLLPYSEIDQDIKQVEELECDMSYTVIGLLPDVIAEDKEIFIVSWTDKKNTFRMLVIKEGKEINYDAKKYKVRNITEEIRNYE